jgi:predicted ester cyclase
VTAHHDAERREAVPDVETTVESVVAEDDRVALFLTIRGTLRGTHPWFGTPPTNELITVTGAAFYRLRDGKIVEDWVVLDQLGHLMELGLVPPSDELIP